MQMRNGGGGKEGGGVMVTDIFDWQFEILSSRNTIYWKYTMELRREEISGEEEEDFQAKRSDQSEA